MTGPFASAAVAYAGHGLHPFPCGGDDGKKPLVKNHLRRRSPDTVRRFAERFPAANVGIPTGPISGLTVVDCDDRDLAGDMLKRCGDTPLIVATTRGFHLYYRHNGERSAGRLDGGAVDIQAKGKLILAPPSVRPDIGTAYETVMGAFGGFDRLPTVKPGSLPLAKSRVSEFHPDARQSAIGAARDGERNKALFAHLRSIGNSVASEGDLIEAALAFAAKCDPPLDAPEALNTARGVWRYVEQGRCVAPGGGGFAHLSGAELASLHGMADARSLLADLKRFHGTKKEPFALVPDRSADVFGMSKHRIRIARQQLIAAGLLAPVHDGGRGKGDPATFRLKPGP